MECAADGARGAEILKEESNLNYRIQHIPLTQTLQRPGLPLRPASLTVHSTGNPRSTAQNERDNLARLNNDRQAGFHVAVDEKEAIECLPLTEVAWHAGDGRKADGGNMSSLALEVCESGDREATLRHAAEVAAYLLRLHGWGTAQLKQHYDWSGKDCPHILRDAGRWDWFVAQVAGLLEEEDMIRYRTLEEVPAGEFREVVGRLMAAGWIRGDGSGVIDLSQDMVRLLVILYRAGFFNKAQA